MSKDLIRSFKFNHEYAIDWFKRQFRNAMFGKYGLFGNIFVKGKIVWRA